MSLALGEKIKFLKTNNSLIKNSYVCTKIYLTYDVEN